MKKITGIIIIIAAFLLAFVAIPAWFDDADLNEYCSQNLIVSEHLAEKSINATYTKLEEQVRKAPREWSWLEKAKQVLKAQDTTNLYIDSLLQKMEIGKGLTESEGIKAKKVCVSLRKNTLKIGINPQDNKDYEARLLQPFMDINLSLTKPQLKAQILALKQINTINMNQIINYRIDKASGRISIIFTKYSLMIAPKYFTANGGEKAVFKLAFGEYYYLSSSTMNVLVNNKAQTITDGVAHYTKTTKKTGQFPLNITVMKTDLYTGEISTTRDTVYYEVRD